MVDINPFVEIGHPTAIHKHISELTPPAIPKNPSRRESTPERTAEIYWQDIQGMIDKTMLNIKRKYPSSRLNTDFLEYSFTFFIF